MQLLRGDCTDTVGMLPPIQYLLLDDADRCSGAQVRAHCAGWRCNCAGWRCNCAGWRCNCADWRCGSWIWSLKLPTDCHSCKSWSPTAQWTAQWMIPHAVRQLSRMITQCTWRRQEHRRQLTRGASATLRLKRQAWQLSCSSIWRRVAACWWRQLQLGRCCCLPRN